MSTLLIFVIGLLVMVPVTFAMGLLVRGIREDDAIQKQAEIIEHPAMRFQYSGTEQRVAREA